MNKYYFTFKSIKSLWSKTAVEYIIYNNRNQIVKREQCEEHLVRKYANEDIKKLLEK